MDMIRISARQIGTEAGPGLALRDMKDVVRIPHLVVAIAQCMVITTMPVVMAVVVMIIPVAAVIRVEQRPVEEDIGNAVQSVSLGALALLAVKSSTFLDLSGSSMIIRLAGTISKYSVEPFSSEVSRKSNYKVKCDDWCVNRINRTSEDDLRRVFSAYGRVQTCIVNVDKRHAFVKMVTREEAVRAKEGMEHYKSPDMQLRVSKAHNFLNVSISLSPALVTTC